MMQRFTPGKQHLKNHLFCITKQCTLLFAMAFLWACTPERYAATIPAYITIDRIQLNTDYTVHGTRSERFINAFIEINDIPLGTYELPVTFPVIANGPTKITLLPGIHQNGISSLPTPYPFVELYQEVIDLKPGVVHYLNAQNDSVPFTTYRSTARVVILEDFDGIGLSLTSSSRADTGIFRTSDPLEIFPAPAGEINLSSGKVVMPARASVFEVITNGAYELPRGGASVYLEINYKTQMPLVTGIVANLITQPVQAPVVTLNPNTQWNKAYINLNSEVSGYNAIDYRIFIGALKTDDEADLEILVDNLKLVF
jgi:hypothetical protein